MYFLYTLGSKIFNILFLKFILLFTSPNSGLPPSNLFSIHRHTPHPPTFTTILISYKLAEEQYVTGYRSLPAACMVCSSDNVNQSLL